MLFRSSELVLDETIDNNLRYVGANPNNYVTFNNELWRIVGVMNHIIDGNGKQESVLKLVRNESIGDYVLDADRRTKHWSISSLKDVLNTTYYNGLTIESQSMIKEALWNMGVRTGGGDGNDLPRTFYEKERGNVVFTGSSVTWNGKIALLYPSDYGFAVGGTDTNRTACLNKTFVDWRYSTCHTNNWLYTNKMRFLTLRNSQDFVYTYHIHSTGGLWFGQGNVAYPTYPAFYLKNNIQIISGNGTIENPFQLAI